MSTNILNVYVIARNNPVIDAVALISMYNDGVLALPEINFVQSHLKKAREALEYDIKEIALNNIDWCGAGSGKNYDDFKLATSLIKGSIDAMVIWDDGSINGVRIKDGKLEDGMIKLEFESFAYEHPEIIEQ